MSVPTVQFAAFRTLSRVSPPHAMAAASVLTATTLLTIESLDQEGRGVARVEGKAIFVEGALPGERVHAVPVRTKPTFEIARVTSVEKANASRVAPRCPHFGVCGGCTLQHAAPALQLAAKQRALEEALARIGRVRAERMLPPIEGPAWGYRYRARLTVRHVAKKGVVLVGFHERKSSFVADMTECHVLPRKISDLLPALRLLVATLTIYDRLPQIELAVGEKVDGSGTLDYVLVLRILAPLGPADETLLREFADQHGIAFWLQTGGPATVVPFHPQDSSLIYLLPEFAIEMPFAPTDFTQVNTAINRVLVRRALAMLDPKPGDRVADFFCGLGNFTLPIARCGADVVGIEGSASLVQRAAANARHNGLEERARFVVANLFQATPESIAGLGRLDRVLIDPPREGAIEVVKALPRGDDNDGLARIVYVSCNPATLARDAEALVHERGYRMTAAGVVNMFPHTAHVESIAQFEK
jgi:23S rRNA (uracil1939-C5)-methyltransferase